ncbi:MAG: hypothetical protein AABX59_00625 [Nanoarchaeota archaeon]
MNKRGKIFALGITLAVVLAVTFSLYLIITKPAGKIEREVMQPLAFLNVQSEAREARHYLEESADLAMQQTLSELLQDFPNIGNCEHFNGIVLYTACRPDVEKSKEVFENKFEGEFNLHLDSYKSSFLTLDKGISEEAYSGIISKQAKENFEYAFDGKALEAKSKERVTYLHSSLKYEIDFSFSSELDFSLDEVENLYTLGKNSFEKCKSESEILNCVDKELQGKSSFFNFSLEKNGSIVVYTFTTRKNYFHSNGFSPLEFKFALQ